MNIRKGTLSGIFLLAVVIFICWLTGTEFGGLHENDVFFPSQGLSEVKHLSDYFAPLKGTPGDTAIYAYEGEQSGGSLLILGGTHPNEPAGFITAVVLAENISVRRGRAFILPQANISGFTHSDPQEGNPQRFAIKTPGGERRFRFGSRLTNPVHQWPDPILHINPAGQ